MSMEFVIQQMKSHVIFSSLVMTFHWEENLVAICRLRIKHGSNKYIDWFYITWNAYHAAKFRLTSISSNFKSVSFLNSSNFWLFRDGKAGKMAVTSLNIYTTSHPLHQTALCFAPLATGSKFGSSDSTGSLKGQSEMTLNRMSSDPNNAVY